MEFFALYVTVDDAIRELVRFGTGALLAKFDVKAAYRNVAIHFSDRYLFDRAWRDQAYVDLVLLFRLRSAPFIFDSITSAVEGILSRILNKGSPKSPDLRGLSAITRSFSPRDMFLEARPIQLTLFCVFRLQSSIDCSRPLPLVQF